MDAINMILAILTAKISAVGAAIEDFLDPTLKMAAKAAPAKTVGDALDAVDGEITEIKEDLSGLTVDLIQDNSLDLIRKYATFTDSSAQGITWSWTGTVCTVTGQAQANTYNSLFANMRKITPGEKLHLYYDSPVKSVRIRIYFKNDSETIEYKDYNESQVITIPDACTNLDARLQVYNGASIDTTIKVGLLTALTNNQIVDILEQVIAPIETGTIASQEYAVGKYFLLNHKFCKAKTAIASGATFTLNTNYEVTTIADELYAALHA